jgi:tRNA nucleotidyltransferase (CCA-adding enzyme)
MKRYLVGGCVRDKILGLAHADRDYLVLNCTADEFLAMHPRATVVGSVNPVFLVNGDEYVLSRHADIHSDLADRDLTINALAMDEDGRILAHPQSMDDLKNKVIRAVGSKNFLNDPLRAVRAARFAAQFPDFSVHPKTIAAMQRVAEARTLKNIPGQRLAREIIKAAKTPKPGRFLRILHRGRCLRPWLEEMHEAAEIPAGPPPFHNGSVLDHTIEVMDRLSGDAEAVWMGLCHDLGKIRTDPAQWPKHHGHDHAGRETARALGSRLCLPNVFIRLGVLAAGLHMLAARYPILRNGTRVDLLKEMRSREELLRLGRLVVADNGPDMTDRMLRDLERIQAVHLPEKHCGKGPESGRILHALQARALAENNGRNEAS